MIIIMIITKVTITSHMKVIIITITIHLVMGTMTPTTILHAVVEGIRHVEEADIPLPVEEVHLVVGEEEAAVEEAVVEEVVIDL